MKKKFLYLLVCVGMLTVTVAHGFMGMTERERSRINDRMDRQNLSEKSTFTVDSSPRMLEQPSGETVEGEFDVAKTPPTVKMMILPGMEPAYFPEEQADHAVWANWGKVTRSNDDRFFFSVGDHRGIGCQINIYEYCPGRESLDMVLDVSDLFGWTDKTYTDGKIHGRMGIMPDGTLWAATHYGVYPDSSWWANGYRGSWMLSYNINTHEAVNHGVPLIGNMLPEFNVDTVRGKFVGTGANDTMLSYDTINRRVVYAGYPPEGWIWWRRAMLLDDETGFFWSTDMSDGKFRFLSFDPELNRFQRYDLTAPPNPFSGQIAQLRGYTEQRTADGAYYCVSQNGTLFRFRPEIPSVEPAGVNWDKGRYTSTVALDPSGRYFYYMPGGMKGQNANEYGPVVQYDTATGRKKVIAWLVDYYYDAYGYWVGGTYGMEISSDGSFLVICMNGAFTERDDENGSPYGNPSLFVVEIPESERPGTKMEQ